ncbi:MAG: PAAR domain-containing protein [Cyanobacteria bacterium P01_H01_bin.105]
MPGPPAARLGDATAHGDPLKPGICSPDVLIGGQKAWRALDPAMVNALLEQAKKAAKSATAAGAASTSAEKAKHLKDLKDAANEMAKIMASTDQHACTVVKIAIPDGNGVVTKGSSSVLINGLPACRVGDPIQEITSVNSIVAGATNVLIGG